MRMVGGLAGAVGAEQAEDFAGPGLEADVIDRVDQAAAQVAERLHQVLDLDHDGEAPGGARGVRHTLRTEHGERRGTHSPPSASSGFVFISSRSSTVA